MRCQHPRGKKLNPLLKTRDLKTWLHGSLSSRDKLLLVLASFDAPCQIQDIKKRAMEAGFRIPAGWNSSTILKRSGGLAIRTLEGWEITNSGSKHLRELGITGISPVAIQVATELRKRLATIKNKEIHSFVEEAIKCYEAEFYRSAIIMSWVGAVAVLHGHTHATSLRKFNAEAKRVFPKWKEAKAVSDLGKMKEDDFLDRIEAIAIIDQNVKRELKRCLGLRNSCGHPSTLQVGVNATAHHIEILLLNVFGRFQ